MCYINNHPIYPVDIKLMNEQNIKLLLHIEDKSFYTHSGFNFKRIIKSVFLNLFKNRSEGASTITQQYIKNVYLNNSKTIHRKIKEIYLAIKLEQIASKDEILTGYLNCLYFGNDVYGLGSASKYYFNKEYYQLSKHEMIYLIALLNSPSLYSNDTNALENKKNNLAKLLYKSNLLTFEEYSICKTKITFSNEMELFPSNLRFFCDGVINEFNKLNIVSNFNEKILINTHFCKEINDFYYDIDGDYSAVCVDKKGFYLAVIGGKNYYKSPFNIALEGKRDIGSTVKPILYYEALKCGYTPKTVKYSSAFSFKYDNQTYTINNYNSIYQNKFITMKEALASSDNIYAIKTHLDIGMKTLSNHFKKYGIAAKPIPSLCLGSVGMSLSELLKIYSQFFTEGYYLNFKFISNVSVDNKVVYIAKENKKVLGNAAKFKQIKDILNGIFDPNIPYSTCRNYSNLLKDACYGKTGLTDFDSYMIGFNEDVLIGVWSGYVDNKILESKDLKNLPKEIFLDMMNSYLSMPMRHQQE